MAVTRASSIGVPTRDEHGESWIAPLVVDDSDPVIFDHSVDHVPGMLMLHGIAELVEWAGPGTGGARCMAGEFDLRFTRFVEKDRPAHAVIAPDGAPHTWRVEISQEGHIACAGRAGTMTLGDGDRPAGHGVAAAIRSAVRAEAAIVHRRRPENIVISPLRPAPAGFMVDYLPSEAARTKRFEHVHCSLDVVEAARQFMIMLSHAACGFGLDRRLVLNRLTVSMPGPFPRTDPVRLHCAPPRVRGGRIDFAMHARCGDHPAATIGWDITAATPAVYARLRGVRHA
jgi:hypothetical protein